MYDITPEEIKKSLVEMENNNSPSEYDVVVAAIKLDGELLLNSLLFTSGTIIILMHKIRKLPTYKSSLPRLQTLHKGHNEDSRNKVILLAITRASCLQTWVSGIA